MSTNTIDMSLYTSLFVTRCTSTFHLTSREWQVEVGAELIQSHLDAVPIRHLCVCPTGGGKSLVFQTVADVLGGVTIFICPLLSLGADQAKKLLSKTHLDCRSITAFHLDELSTDAIKKLKGFFQSAEYIKSTTSIIFFASPQAITKRYKPFIDYLIKCNLISFVVVDEIHLAVHFGSSFTKEFLLLKDSFFLKVNPNIPMAFFTATCSDFIQSSVEKMFGFEFNRSHWPSSSEMTPIHVKQRLFLIRITEMKRRRAKRSH
uniref:DNA 3'-5' helicase n=1 Tax=Chaetoceros debilis TaxID=122233 RepID=A0A7S3V4R0_9STRA